MDGYWNQVLREVPDSWFIKQDQEYSVIQVWRDSSNSNASRVDKIQVKQEDLRSWAQKSQASEIDGKGDMLIFQCLIISTHNCNDFPLDIDRDDLLYIAQALQIPAALLAVNFASFTGHTFYEREVCWCYGIPGARAIAATRTDSITCYTNAIMIAEDTFRLSMDTKYGQLLHLADHPLILMLIIRAFAIDESQDVLMEFIMSLRAVENMVGFGIREWPKNGSAYDLTNGPQDFPRIDLGKLSRRVGSDASALGNIKVMVSRLDSVKDIIRVGDNEELKWSKLFSSNTISRYKQQSEAIMDADSIVEAKRQIIFATVPEYQDRARNLLSVIFNLIAREDANASIQLAKESRTIATAAKNDGTSMKTVAIMTMLFLPATFYAALFAMPTLQWNQSPVIQGKFWIYWAFTLPSTIIVILSWYFLVESQFAPNNDRSDETDHKYQLGGDDSSRTNNRRPRPFIGKSTAILEVLQRKVRGRTRATQRDQETNSHHTFTHDAAFGFGNLPPSSADGSTSPDRSFPPTNLNPMSMTENYNTILTSHRSKLHQSKREGEGVEKRGEGGKQEDNSTTKT